VKKPRAGGASKNREAATEHAALDEVSKVQGKARRTLHLPYDGKFAFAAPRGTAKAFFLPSRNPD